MVYVFGIWRIDTARRETLREGQAVALPRRVFDLVVYLLQQRSRAVGRDELVSAVWGRVDVADVQISQLIARTRRLLGDDAQNQSTIRTVSGFGYRWVMPVQEVQGEPAPALAAVAETVVPPVADGVTSTAALSTPMATPLQPRAARQRRAWFGALAALIALSVVALALRFADRRAVPTPSAAAVDAIAVLPMQTDAGDEASWMQLGLMDLVAGRLRAGGLAVPPSDSVLVALRALDQRPRDDGASADVDAERLNPILGTRRLVRGSVRRIAAGWRVTLEAPDGEGQPRRVETERADPVAAAREAADLLLAALGHRGARAGEEDTPDLLIQRSQAAILGGHFDTAQDILDAAAPAQRDTPRVQLQIAQIDFYRGQLDASASRLEAVLAAAPAGEVRTRALTARGMLRMRRGDCAGAEQSFTQALALPGPSDATALAGRGLARSCGFAHREAADDLGLARLRLEAAGDRLGVARVDNYLAIADANRNHLEPALARFDSALATYEAFGVADAQRAALSGLLDTHVLLLRWQDAARDAQRLQALRPRIADAGHVQLLASDHARVLAGMGRYRQAEELLGAVGGDADAAALRYREATRAELAWRRGQPVAAGQAASRALADWPAHVDDVRRASMQLLRQRAGGVAADTSAQALDQAGAGAALLQLAAAEAASSATERERRYRVALDAADAVGVPAVIAEVTRGYVAWLLQQQRLDEAAAVSGRIAAWSAADFDCALLRVALFQARGDTDAWSAALAQARDLAGERVIPPELSRAPPLANVRKVIN